MKLMLMRKVLRVPGVVVLGLFRNQFCSSMCPEFKGLSQRSPDSSKRISTGSIKEIQRSVKAATLKLFQIVVSIVVLLY